MKTRSLFHSSMFWGVTFGTLALVAPIVGEVIKEGHLSVDNGVRMAVIVLGGAGTIAKSVEESGTSLYTPEGLPGPNKLDLEKNADTEILERC